MDVAIKELSQLDATCKILDDKSKTYNDYEKTLGLGVTRFESLENMKLDLSLRFTMWKSLKEWKDLITTWKDGKFTDINTEEIRTKGEFYTKIVNRCTKNLRQNPILDELRKLVFDFRDTMPIVIALRNKNLKDYHWQDIETTVG